MHREFYINNSHKLRFVWKPLLAVLFWGASFIATKIALQELNPLVIVFIRQLLGISLLSSVVFYKRKSFVVTSKDFRWILLLSSIAVFHLWIQVTGLQYTTASNTGWIVGITPVFMVLLGLFFFKEKITATQISGIIISFVGLVVLISKGDPSSIDLISNKGDFLVLVSSFTWSAYSLIGKKITLNFSPILTILFLFIIMSVIVAPFSINEDNIRSVLRLSLEGWISILFLGLLCSGIAYVLWAQALSEMASSKVGAFLYIEPFVTVFTASIFLNEQITLLTFVSGIIIILGVVLVNRK